MDEVVVNLEDTLEQKLKRASQAIQQAQMAMVRIEPKRFLLASRNRLDQLAGRAGYAFISDFRKRCCKLPPRRIDYRL